MNQDANAIITLCSHICVGEGVCPLEPREYGELARKLIAVGKTPKDLFFFSEDDFAGVLGFAPEQTERVKRLLDRSASLNFELGQYQNMGIEAVTRADASYPVKLRKKLGGSCPPIFYCAGDLSLLNRESIGYVGSRNISVEDVEFTKRAVQKTVSLGYGVVSGGAKGIDTVSGIEALGNGSFSLEFLSDSLLKKLKQSSVIRNIQNGALLLLSIAKPDAGFQTGMAMMRNRYIYAQSSGTVVVRSELNKGGTWAGASENLKKGWCQTMCWSHPYPGNLALIQKGAAPIGDDWDGHVPEAAKNPAPPQMYEQVSMFD